MSIQLVIHDGTSYWWESPDIWTVPGPDPNGPLGTPVIGQDAYIWATVANTGDQDASGVQVDFWVANPSAQIRKSTAVHVGASFADVPAGGSQDVLCLAPWHVQLFNGGHECVVVQASHAADPLTPTPIDPDVLDAPTYRQIAQRNITLAVAQQRRMEVLVGVHAGMRAGRQVIVETQTGGELSTVVLEQLGVTARKPARANLFRAVLARESMCGADREGEEKIELEVVAGAAAGVFVGIQAGEIRPEEYGLVRIIEREGGEIRGGVSFVVVHESHARRKRA